MGKKRKSKTDSHRSAQRARTKANKIKKYTRLIEQYLDNPHIENWKNKLKSL